MNTPIGAPESRQPGQMGSWACYYDFMMAIMTFGKEHKLRQMTLDLAQVKSGDKVLEIGCGTGTLTLAARVRVGASGEATGIDIAPEMVEVANCKATRKGINATFQIGNIENIPFPDSRFNVVLCSFMIFHMPDTVRRKGLVEIYRVLKPGGNLLILDFALPDKWGKHQHHVRELEPILKECSFIETKTAKAGFMGTWFILGKAWKA